MKTRILLVEDDDALRTMTRLFLESEGYEVQVAENGLLAVQAFESGQPDIIVSDIAMPEMNGFELLEVIRQHEAGAGMPFLFVSAFSGNESVSRARRLGVDDYLFKPFEVKDLRDAIEIRLARRRTVQLADTREAHLQTVTMLARAIEERDAYTGGHVDRVCAYSRDLANALHWDQAALIVLEFGAILHDVGKIGIPDEILNKRGKLNEEEQKIMRSHTELGTNMLREITHLQAALPYISYHHERWDGKGYPHQLAANEIPMEGRLLAIVDAYDAMTTDRPYSNSQTTYEALENLKHASGSQFDRVMVDAFVKLMG